MLLKSIVPPIDHSSLPVLGSHTTFKASFCSCVSVSYVMWSEILAEAAKDVRAQTQAIDNLFGLNFIWELDKEFIWREYRSVIDPQEFMRFMIEFPILPLMFFIILQNLTIQSRNFTKTILVKIICVIFIWLTICYIVKIIIILKVLVFKNHKNLYII